MAGMDPRTLAVDEPGRERFRLALTWQLESDDRAAVFEARLVVDVGLVARRGGTHDLEDSAIEIGLLDIWHAVGRGAVPAVADSRGEVAVFLAVERVLEDEGAFFLEPGGVVARRRLRGVHSWQ